MADPIDRQVATIVHSLKLQPDWKKKMANLAVENYDGPSPTALQEKRRRHARAYADGAYTDDEYKRRLAEIDHQIQQAISITPPDIEDAIKLFEDIPMLWNEATPEERRTLVKSLVELVYVDIQTKRVTAVKPTPAFRALFGVGIDVGPNVPIEIITPEHKSNDNVGVGGDGGESNSPSRESYPGYTTSLASSFISLGSPLLTEVEPGQSMFSFIALIDVRAVAPQYFGAQAQPIEERSSRTYSLFVRLRKLIQVRQLYFCHLFNEVGGNLSLQSCSAPALSNPRVPIWCRPL